MISVLQGRLAGVLGVLGLVGLVIADGLDDRFWGRHALIASLVANLAVIALTVGVVNEVADRRARRRWSGLAQYVMVELVRSSRLAWTFLLDVGELLPEPDDRPTAEQLAASRSIARDTPRVRAALAATLADPRRRALVGQVLGRIGELSREVISSWANVMIGAPAYATIFDRHVELHGRVGWVATLFTLYEEEDPTPARRWVASSSIAVQLTERFDDEWILEMLLSIVGLAVRLDVESTAMAMTLVSAQEWTARTADLIR